MVGDFVYLWRGVRYNLLLVVLGLVHHLLIRSRTMRRSDEYEGNIRRISAIAPSASPRVRKSPTRTRQYGDWNVRYTRYCGRRAIRLRRLAVARDLAVRTLLSAKTSTRKPVPARGRDMPELSPAASSVAFERSCNSAGWVMCMCPELLSSRTISTLSGSVAVAGL